MKLIAFLKPYTFLIILLIAFTLGQVAATLELPDFTAKIINEGIVGGNQSVILPTGLEMLLITFLGGLCTVVAGFLAARIGTGYARDLREALFTKVESFSLAEIKDFSTASLITRSTNDIQQLQMVVVMILRMVLSAPITAVWAINKAVGTAPDMSWLMVVAVLNLLAIITVLFSLAVPKFQLIQKITDQLNMVAKENLTGIRVIRAFNNQPKEQRRTGKVNEDLTQNNLFVSRLMSVMQPAMFLILNLLSVGVIWFGSHLVIEYSLGIGDMLAFLQYAIQVIISFLLISIVFIMLPRALVSGKRIDEVLKVKPSISDPQNSSDLHSTSHTGKIEFKNVTFGYSQADVPVLENISFTAIPGQSTAIIGSTGSGKSTLINLIPRFYDPLYGDILLDGIPLTELPLKFLRDKIGYIPQKAVIFSGTIAHNIGYVSEASNEEIERAAKIAQAADFIEKLPKKYKTPIAQNGTNLSGGQKQRISIARAIAKNPSVYIFDDTFSALDFKTESKLRHALSEEVRDKSVIIVAQRINTILHADQIVVLDAGKIVGKGTHKELMRTCSVYRDIAKSQLSEEELHTYSS